MQTTWKEASGQTRLVLRLRALYERYGYTRFPMRRFEEYALYAENKSFLKSEGILTFTSAAGRLMALKPDVTLSIVKQARAGRDEVEKLYYNESVYRLSPTDHEFREIEQLGVECLGDVDGYAVCEVVRLALETLKTVGPESVLEIGHMGFAAGLMRTVGLTDGQRERLFPLIRQKNEHELRAALTDMGVRRRDADRIARLPALSGAFSSTLATAREVAVGGEMFDALEELEALHRALGEVGGVLRLDMSTLNDLDYYNGLVMRGYVVGVPRAVLAGGQYDLLTRKFGKSGGGLGFALYLDELTRLLTDPVEYDADVLALYGADDNAGEVLLAADALRQKGLRVFTARRAPAGLRARRVARFREHGFGEVE